MTRRIRTSGSPVIPTRRTSARTSAPAGSRRRATRRIRHRTRNGANGKIRNSIQATYRKIRRANPRAELSTRRQVTWRAQTPPLRWSLPVMWLRGRLYCLGGTEFAHPASAAGRISKAAPNQRTKRRRSSDRLSSRGERAIPTMLKGSGRWSWSGGRI